MKSYKMKIGDEVYSAKIVEYTESHVTVNLNGMNYFVEIEHEEPPVIPNYVHKDKSKSEKEVFVKKRTQLSLTPGIITAPIPGVIKKILVNEGDSIKEGDVLVNLEAMKMESEINADIDGIIKIISINIGASVLEGDILVEIGE